MEKYWAIQWQNPETLGWETCQAFDDDNNEIPTLFLEQEAANIDLQEWRDSIGTYRMIEVVLQEVT